MKRPFSIVLSAALFTSVIAGALTLSTLKLMQPKSASSTAAAPTKEVASSTMVGTDHPVPVNPPLRLPASPKSNRANPSGTPVPRASALLENVSRHQAQSLSQDSSRHDAESLADNASSRETDSPVELVREKAEQARERAERLRARVEDLYQSHRISEAAYKQGQAAYQQELAKYEDQIAKLHLSTSGTGASNE